MRAQLAREGEEAALRQRAIFESASDAIILINPSGSIETINPAAERMFGYRAAELLRRDISTLIDIAPGDGPFLERVGYADGRLARKELIDLAGRNGDGEPVPVDVMLGVMPLPDGVHIIAALRDATGRREIERLKDDFISTVSHELRTPLTSVVGSLGLLRSGAAGELPAAAQRLAEIADNNSQRLIRLINDILDVDQIRKGRMAFDYALIDLRDVVARTVQTMQGLADRKAIRVETRVPDGPAMAFADAERLVQVTSNLASNAVKFSPDGSIVLIELVEGNDTHIIQITDSGPGIDPEFSTQLFQRFAQGSQPGAQLIAGTGLGLAISRARSSIIMAAKSASRIAIEGGRAFRLHHPARGSARRQGRSWRRPIADLRGRSRRGHHDSQHPERAWLYQRPRDQRPRWHRACTRPAIMTPFCST